ncbi:hypothetical protein HYY75_10895 [bacterium]|nr:hypothetical protein [bacterium]
MNRILAEVPAPDFPYPKKTLSKPFFRKKFLKIVTHVIFFLVSSAVLILATPFNPISSQGDQTLNEQSKSWNGETIYFVLIDRFKDGSHSDWNYSEMPDINSFHGGNLKGIINSLDYLENLGVTTLWISPVFSNRPSRFYNYSAYHGYWVWDFFQMDPRFGTLSQLKELSEGLHKRGMKLILDFVVNHMDYDAPFVKKFPEWFHPYGTIVDWNDSFQLENFKVFGLPDFASEKPIVQKFFRAVARYWIEQVNPDGFRLDAVKHVPISFWGSFNGFIHESYGSQFFLLGEFLNGDESIVSNVQATGNFDSLFDFPLYYTLVNVIAKGKSAKQIGHRLYNDYQYLNAGNLATFLDNHDVERFVSSCEGDLRKYKLGLSFILTSRGIPTLYYGDEVGLPGSQEPDNRRDMNFKLNPEIRNFVTALLDARKSSLALKKGIQMQLFMDDTTYAFCRFTPNEQAIAIFNFASSTKNLQIPLLAAQNEGQILNEAIEGKNCARIHGKNLFWSAPSMSSGLFLLPKSENIYLDLFNKIQGWKKDPWFLGDVKVTFELRFPEEKNSESVRPKLLEAKLVGSLPAIGKWDPKSAIPLVRQGKGNAYSASLKLPSKGIFEYKYFLKREKDVIWQKGDNFLVELPESGGIHLFNNWEP